MISENRENGMDNTRSFVPISKGTMISHYKIIEKIGAGGMGEVYLAEDTELNRKVALKFLPPHLCQEEDCRSRFKREAQATAKLDHPNIITIYEVSEYRERPFFAMQLVEGQSLRESSRGKEFSLDSIIELAIQICDGLGAAHDKKVVHRDIKPSNIMIDAYGRPKILDFGLAAIQGGEHLTKTGSTLGTVRYMSPEQVQGKEIDQRSDLFSLGIVLYEIIAGRTPFERDNEAATLKAITEDSVEPLARYKAGVPDGLQGIVSKCLEKDPSMRYQTAWDLLSDLRRLTRDGAIRKESQRWRHGQHIGLYSAAAAVLIMLVAGSLYLFTGSEDTITSIAVLPFENLSGDPEQEYLVDGITDALITALAQISALQVTSRTSSMQYKGTQKSIKEIADELNVDAVVEGTVPLIGEQVHVAARLIEARTDRCVWADKYERDLKDILTLQSDVAKAIAREIEVAVTPQEQQQLEKTRTVNPDAYRYYLRGNFYFNRSWSEQDIGTAIGMYQKAVGLDPEFAMAYASLSRGHSAMYREFYDHTSQRLLMARQAVDTAYYLEPDLPDAHHALGKYYYSYMQYDSAMIAFAIALKSQPNNSDLYTAIAAVQRQQGKIDSALVNFKIAFKLDPLSSLRAFDISYTYGLIREYFVARAYLDSSILIAPDRPLPYIYKAWLYLFMEGNKQEAARVLQEASGKIDLAQSEYREYYWWLSRILDDDYLRTLEKITLGSDATSYYLYRARIYGLMNEHRLKWVYSDSARALLEPRLNSFPDEPRYHSNLGLAYAGLGRKEEAISEGIKGMKLSRGPLNKQFMVKNLAEIYVLTGEFDAAVETLEMLLSIPGLTSPEYLKIDPIWKPLYEHTGFVKLL